MAAILDVHVAEFLVGHPWKPFHHTLGISGYEVYFDHPDQLFFSLASALPYLSPTTSASAKRFLVFELERSPPYAIDGFDRRMGRSRESYEVPSSLRVAGRGKATSAFGVYAFWAYCHYASNSAAARGHWKSVLDRATPLLQERYDFDLLATNSTKADGEKLNGDLAGLIGLIRLAGINGDAATEKTARRRAMELLNLRVNLERTNPHLVQKSTSATKNLHNFKAARYCNLIPEIGDALCRHSAGCAVSNLRSFREERNGWFMAFGDRLIGGENCTNPLNFSRALFAGAALVEQLPAEQLLTFIDVPWCKADLYFVEKCALALWAATGRPWINL